MTREDFDSLLEELTHEDLTTDRQLEIFATLQQDKDKSIADYNTLNEKTSKLQDDFETIRKKKVDDFFNRGTEFEPKETEPKEKEDELPTYEQIVDEMLGGN